MLKPGGTAGSTVRRAAAWAGSTSGPSTVISTIRWMSSVEAMRTGESMTASWGDCVETQGSLDGTTDPPAGFRCR